MRSYCTQKEKKKKKPAYLTAEADLQPFGVQVLATSAAACPPAPPPPPAHLPACNTHSEGAPT